MRNNINTFNEAKVHLLKAGMQASDSVKIADLMRKISLLSQQHNRLIDILQKQEKLLDMEDVHGITVDHTGKGSLGLATSTTDGALSSTDWATFDGKQDHSNELDALSDLADTAGFVKKLGDASYEIDTSSYALESIWGAL